MDKLLFTPGPLTTSPGVKAAMQRDVGSRDAEFLAVVARVRRTLLELAGAPPPGPYECVLVQGSGTYGIEAVVSSAVPEGGRLLVFVNGAYGARIARIGRVHDLDTVEVRIPEDRRVEPADVAARLAADARVSHVAVVHCETSTGLMNPVEEIGAAVRSAGRTCVVDSMSAFGGVPLDVPSAGIDFLVSSSNKCIEGVPGFAFVIARRTALEACAGRARTLALDLHDQWKGLEATGQFRFTPPTHAILAFDRALAELAEEGGVEGRARRYLENHAVLIAGMRALGFEAFLPDLVQGPIITSFRYPDHPRFSFDALYRGLSDRGFVIYPGKLTDAACFRIGNIGRIDANSMRRLLEAVEATLAEMGVRMPA